MVNQAEDNSHGNESNNDQELEERKSEATSAEKVADLPETEEDSGSKSDLGPSPDGALDESDDMKDAGPM